MRNAFLSLSRNFNSRYSTALVAAAFTAAAGATWYKNATRCDSMRHTQHNRKEQKDSEDSKQSFRIESHLMDRIQQKKYLSDAKDGIPSTFRVLAIDVPEMRTKAFTGECVQSHERVYLDDVAPPKAIRVLIDDHGQKNKKQRLEIAQKSLVKSIVHCSSPLSQQHVGVELLEASVSNLNRFKVRKKQSFGSYTYDPGKYYDSTTSANDDDEIDEIDEGQVPLDKERSDEMEAPWNQYAWMEELNMRINGRIGYDAPVEKAPKYERLLYGNNYKSTVPAVYKVWDFFMPFSFARSDPNGIDGRNQPNVRACNKPHAVIANGAALQLVPSSLRLLQKLCKKADVPLFVVHDPRQWGGNTQASLQEALVAMRSTVKNRIIGNALKQKGSSAFTRGRVLGQIETEAKWQLKDKRKRTRELLGIEGGRRRKHEKEDWSVYDASALENKFIEKKLIQLDNGTSDDDPRRIIYSQGLLEIARECIENWKGENEEHRRPESLENPVD